MKKIGILTFHNSNNYGAILQNFALFSVCSRDNEVEVINYINTNVKNDSIFDDVAREKSISEKMIMFTKKIIFLPVNVIKNNRFNKFRKDNLKISNIKISNSTDFYDNKLDITHYIVGSDQVWNKNIVQDHLPSYFLNMKKKAIKISYAASMGEFGNIKKIDSEIIKDIKKYLIHFNAISVREKSSKDFLENKMGIDNVKSNIDPTLLLTKSEWSSIASKKKETEDYILLYVVEENEKIKEITDELSLRTGLKVIYFSKFSDVKNKFKSSYTAGPKEFISLFRDASYVVTNSFHGTVFSIIFEKKFFVINHLLRGNRISELLSLLNLENRIVKNKEELTTNDNINYDEVNKVLTEERERGISYITEAIKNGNI